MPGKVKKPKTPWIVIVTLSYLGGNEKVVAVETMARGDQHARMNGVLAVREHYPEARNYQLNASSEIGEGGVLADNAVLDYKPEEHIALTNITEIKPNPEGNRSPKASSKSTHSYSKYVVPPDIEHSLTPAIMEAIAENNIIQYDSLNNRKAQEVAK